MNLYPDEFDNFDFDNGKSGRDYVCKKKQKNERENGIIDEEDVDVGQVRIFSHSISKILKMN